MSEISFNYNFTVTNGGFSEINSGQANLTQTAIGSAAGVEVCTTSYVDIPYGSVAVGTVGYLILKNLDAAIAITWAVDTTPYSVMVPVGVLNAGETAILRLSPSVQIAAKSASSTAKLKYNLYRD